MKARTGLWAAACAALTMLAWSENNNNPCPDNSTLPDNKCWEQDGDSGCKEVDAVFVPNPAPTAKISASKPDRVTVGPNKLVSIEWWLVATDGKGRFYCDVTPKGQTYDLVAEFGPPQVTEVRSAPNDGAEVQAPSPDLKAWYFEPKISGGAKRFIEVTPKTITIVTDINEPPGDPEDTNNPPNDPGDPGDPNNPCEGWKPPQSREGSNSWDYVPVSSSADYYRDHPPADATLYRGLNLICDNAWSSSSREGHSGFLAATNGPPTRYFTYQWNHRIKDRRGGEVCGSYTETYRNWYTVQSRAEGIQRSHWREYDWRIPPATTATSDFHRESEDGDQKAWADLSSPHTPEAFLSRFHGNRPDYAGKLFDYWPHASYSLNGSKTWAYMERTKFRFKWGPGTTDAEKHPVNFLVLWNFWDDPDTAANEGTNAPVLLRTITWPGWSNDTQSTEHEIDPLAEPQAGKNGWVSLLPVDITVTKKGDAVDPQGVSVKKGDVLEIALAESWFSQEKQFENLITWQYRQMKLDGTFEDWTDFGSHGKGTKFKHTTALSGIFELKAVINSGGAAQDQFYVRKKDDAHSAHKKGENDCFGVADDQWQLNVRRQAWINLGNTAYARGIANPPIPAGPPGGWKCNLFVAHKATDGGATVPWINGNIFQSYPPVANQWAGTEVKNIPNWPLLGADAKPQPGYVVARGATGGSGHTGILDYDGAWISAGVADVNRKSDLRNGTYQPARIRKYTGN